MRCICSIAHKAGGAVDQNSIGLGGPCITTAPLIPILTRRVYRELPLLAVRILQVEAWGVGEAICWAQDAAGDRMGPQDILSGGHGIRTHNPLRGT